MQIFVSLLHPSPLCSYLHERRMMAHRVGGSVHCPLLSNVIQQQQRQLVRLLITKLITLLASKRSQMRTRKLIVKWCSKQHSISDGINSQFRMLLSIYSSIASLCVLFWKSYFGRSRFDESRESWTTASHFRRPTRLPDTCASQPSPRR